MATDPFDPSTIMKMFDPGEIAKAFDPDRMRPVVENFKMPGIDINAVFDSNRKNFEAMKAANGAAAAGYRELYERQMAIFQTLMEAAREASQTLTGPDTAKRQVETYRTAMESALALMTEMAEQAQVANEKAATIIQARVDEAVSELKGE